MYTPIYFLRRDLKEKSFHTTSESSPIFYSHSNYTLRNEGLFCDGNNTIAYAYNNNLPLTRNTLTVLRCSPPFP